MKIRKATTKDLEQIKTVFLDYEKASMGYLPRKYRLLRNKTKPIDKNIRKALLKDIHAKEAIFLVAEEHKRVVGYIFGHIRDDRHPLWNPPKTGELTDIAVLSTHRGFGIGSKLWHELLKWFKKEKCTFITLSVNVNNNAQEIYKKWGFDKFYLRMIKKM
jgi:ribosomal protein S18 acetylase RimI-like enzyme